MGDGMMFEDSGRVIKVTHDVLETLHRHIQLKLGCPESGGVLIGRENSSNNNLIIEYTTSPMSLDVQRRTKFERKDPSHVKYYEGLYNESGGIYCYVGEWHTHPERVPNYSLIDLDSWKAILHDSGSIQGHFHMIAGIDAFRIWKLTDSKQKPKLMLSMNWRDVFLNDGM